MIVVILISAPEAVKGFTSRYLIEVSAGVFAGTLNRRVRDSLWDFITTNIKRGQALLMHTKNNAQGYQILSVNFTKREVVEYDGLQLLVQLHREKFSDTSPPKSVMNKTGWSRLSYQNRNRVNKKDTNSD